MALFKSHIFVKLEVSSVRESGRGLTEIVVSIYAYILFFFTAGRQVKYLYVSCNGMYLISLHTCIVFPNGNESRAINVARGRGIIDSSVRVRMDEKLKITILSQTWSRKCRKQGRRAFRD